MAVYNYGLLETYSGVLWGIVAYNYGLLYTYDGLLWGIVAYNIIWATLNL